MMPSPDINPFLDISQITTNDDPNYQKSLIKQDDRILTYPDSSIMIASTEIPSEIITSRPTKLPTYNAGSTH
jgi:hypothetical protein